MLVSNSNSNENDHNIDVDVLNKLSLLANVTHLDVQCTTNHVIVLEAILKKCKNKIETLLVQMQISSNYDNIRLSPMRLNNLKKLSMSGLNFSVQWTNKCQELIIDEEHNISNEWCTYVIDNCDCSGIKMLHLNAVTFHRKIDRSALEKLAQQFSSLQRLKISFSFECDDHVFLLWKLLNNTIVELQTTYMFDTDLYNLLSNSISNAKFKVNKLRLSVGTDDEFWQDQFESIQKLIGNAIPKSSLEYIKIDNCQETGKQWGAIMTHFDSNFNTFYLEAFELFQAIEIEDYLQTCSTMKLINEFLNLNIIFKKHLLVVGNFAVEEWNHYDFMASFDKILKSVVRLIASQIPLDIEISFQADVNPSQLVHEPVYALFLDVYQKQLFEGYKHPKCNKFCVGLMKPCAFFVVKDSGPRLHITNVQKIN